MDKKAEMERLKAELTDLNDHAMKLQIEMQNTQAQIIANRANIALLDRQLKEEVKS